MLFSPRMIKPYTAKVVKHVRSRGVPVNLRSDGYILAHRYGRADDAARWQDLATRMRAAIRQTFWRDRRWYDDRQRSTFSQLATALALLAGATEPSEEVDFPDGAQCRSFSAHPRYHLAEISREVGPL